MITRKSIDDYLRFDLLKVFCIETYGDGHCNNTNNYGDNYNTDDCYNVLNEYGEGSGVSSHGLYGNGGDYYD